MEKFRFRSNFICVSVLLQRRTKGRNPRRIQSRIFNKSILFSGDTMDEPEHPESGWEEVGPQSQRTFQRYGIPYSKIKRLEKTFMFQIIWKTLSLAW